MGIKTPNDAYFYALDILKAPWPEAEEYIKQDAHYAYMYARFILKERWPEAEPYIKQNTLSWDEYKEHFNI